MAARLGAGEDRSNFVKYSDGWRILRRLTFRLQQLLLLSFSPQSPVIQFAEQ